MQARKHDKNNNNVDDRLEWLTNICAVLLPLSTLPQLYEIFVKRQTDGVAGLTWFLYGLLTIPLLIYSIKKRDTPLIILNGLWVVVDFVVWIGVLIY